jgi:myo-inositol 2-dehydrogenase/D-chiro-inositol 1-dehydrogenase
MVEGRSGADALRAGKHVLCEKPMARTPADCRAMMREADKADRVLMVAHCRRFDPHWGGFRKLVEKDRIGRPIIWRHCNAGMGPANPWFMDDQLGGGPLMDGAIHNYDYGNWLFGDPQRVVAQGASLRPVSAITTGTAVVEYPEGDQLVVSWSWGTPSHGHIFDALGPRGTIVFGAAGEPIPHEPGVTRYTVMTDDGHKKLHEVRPAERYTDMYVNQGRHFVGLVSGKEKENRSPGSEAIKAVAGERRKRHQPQKLLDLAERYHRWQRGGT